MNKHNPIGEAYIYDSCDFRISRTLESNGVLRNVGRNMFTSY